MTPNNQSSLECVRAAKILSNHDATCAELKEFYGWHKCVYHIEKNIYLYQPTDYHCDLFPVNNDVLIAGLSHIIARETRCAEMREALEAFTHWLDMEDGPKPGQDHFYRCCDALGRAKQLARAALGEGGGK